jgi:hypothetical protein
VLIVCLCHRRVLGWLHRENGVPLADLQLSHVVPSSGRSGVSVAFEYLQWLGTERNVSTATQGLSYASGC